eukprot:NODE_707_length_4970_cov_0.408335.p2 type:complete len:273 gc:universal NODE_707_length_4970_cov_0.408335:2233-3051(+)
MKCQTRRPKILQRKRSYSKLTALQQMVWKISTSFSVSRLASRASSRIKQSLRSSPMQICSITGLWLTACSSRSYTIHCSVCYRLAFSRRGHEDSLRENREQGRAPKTGTQELKAMLTEFYQEQYEPLIVDTMNYHHLNTVPDYTAIEVITMKEINIKQHFCEYVERFVNVVHHEKDQIEAIMDGDSTAEPKTERINSRCRELRKVKNDILSVNEPKTSDAEYHAWIDSERVNIIPQRAHSESGTTLDLTGMDVSCAMVSSSVALVQGCGTEM